MKCENCGLAIKVPFKKDGTNYCAHCYSVAMMEQYERSKYCHHGTYIGSFWGEDHLCLYCEGVKNQ